MSSEMFLYENSILVDPFFPFSDPSAVDSHLHESVFQEYECTDTIHPENEGGNPADETNLLNEIASVLLSSSPSSFKLENLSLTQLRNSEVLGGVKTEECGLKLDADAFVPQMNIDESAAKLMQRSYSSNSSLGAAIMDTRNFQNQMLSPPESTIFSSGQMIRRVCSTGDLQLAKTSSVLSSSLSEANFKIGRYSAEERKGRIDRYKAKRTQRNFNKTIKYACRKTLADNRMRIRGRFARNEEGGEIPKASIFHRYEDEDYFWKEGFHQEDDEGIVDGVGSACLDGLDATLLQMQYENYNQQLLTSTCRKQMPRPVQFK